MDTFIESQNFLILNCQILDIKVIINNVKAAMLCEKL